MFLSLAFGDARAAAGRERGPVLAGSLLCAAAAIAFVLYGTSDANDREWRTQQYAALSVARLAPLLFGAGLLLCDAGRGELRNRAPALIALLCPLFTPAPAWLRLRIDPSAVSAWGAEHVLQLLGEPAQRAGSSILLAQSELRVNSECSGLGAILQLFAVLVLLGLVTRCSWRKIAALVPLAVAVAFAVNFCRLAALARLADRGDFVRFDYWHLGPGSLLHPLVATVALLAVALPLTAPRMSAGPARN